MKKVCILFIVTVFSHTVFAQGVTTSYITGHVKDLEGNGLIGANIVAVHLPSGSNYGTVAQNDGYFAISNVLPGGPYKVTVSFIGYKIYVVEGVNLQLAEPFQLNVKLSEEGQQLNEVVVLGKEDQLLNSSRNGALTNLGTNQILYSPTITRNINDLTRFTPQATSTSPGAMGGGNYRQNYITVDGSDFNNSFGIGGNLPAGGTPISLDALSEISVNITPFDVRQSGFVGSSVSAVTRSGTNQVEGSVYTYFRNQNQQGNKVGDATFIRQKLNVNTVGFRLGAPVIKDKVFLFINTEFTGQTTPGQTNVAATSNDPFTGQGNVARPTASELDNISAYLKSKYGYETGKYQGYDLTSKNFKFLTRLDWNINKNHRLNIRYSSTKFILPTQISANRAPVPASFNPSRTANNALWFENSNFNQETNFYSLAAELNSRFGGKYSNTLRFTYTNQDEPRSSNSQVFPFVDILKANGAQLQPFTSFGYEPYTYGNTREVKSFSVIDNLSFNINRHLFTVGAQFDFSTSRNGFQPFATSYYTFNSWDDFVNGKNPADFALTYSLLPDFKQAYSRIRVATYSAYAQDEWEITSRFKMTYGIRLELPQFLKMPEILTNPMVEQLTFADGRKIDTGALPTPPVLASPRIGFNWDVKGDRSIQLRGGSGIFTGRIPLVFLIAQSGNAGMIQFTQLYPTNNTPGPFNPDPNAYRPATVPQAGKIIPLTVSAMDKNLKYPQTWKSSLAVDAKLPWGMIGTLEAMYNKDLRVFRPINPNLVEPSRLSNETNDNREIFPAANNNKFINPVNSKTGQVDHTSSGGAFNPIILTTAYNQGYYLSLTAKLEKRFDNALSAMAAFTKSYSQVMFDGDGTLLSSTFGAIPIINNPNTPQVSYAGYVVPTRLIMGGSYHKEFFKNLGATLSLFYEGSTAGRYSYTYTNDFNRDGQNNDLMYVPKDANDITFVDSKDPKTNAVLFTAQQQSDALFKYINEDPYLKTRKGQYAERNGAQYPWRGQLDLKLAVDIMKQGKESKHTLQFTVDIFNLGNLLNPRWGTFRIVNTPALLTAVNTSAFTPDGSVKPTFQMATYNGQLPTSVYRDNLSITSTYYMQLGVRYIFN